MRAVRNWALGPGLLTEHDILVSADTDEVLSRAALRRLAACQLAGTVIRQHSVMLSFPSVY